MFYLVMMIFFIVFSFGAFIYGIRRLMNVIKHPMPKTIDYHDEIKKLLYLVGGITVSVLLTFIFLSLYQGYSLNVGEWVELIIGSLLFGVSFPSAVFAFILHYYAKELDEKLKKYLFYTLLGSLFLICVGLWLLTNGIADHILYPLVNGINFQEGFVSPISSVKPNLAWYAICIISGATLVLFICDHRFYKEYGKHGILESTFFIAFPAGIIGARLGYVIGEWNHGTNSFAERVANGEWWAPLAVWEGGLTIISGAIIGIVVGVLWYLYANKKYSIWFAVDVIVPCILVAQAVGRWGNFFNSEVHGLEVPASSMWFLPKIVLNNMRYSDVAGWASEGMIYLPLFYIESITNLLGYFMIRFVIGKGLRKYLELGDLAFLYVAWYGLTRVILEPLRHPSYNMGNDGYWSWVWSIIFFLIAMSLIAINHNLRFILEERKGKSITVKNSLKIGSIGGGLTLILAISYVAVGSLLMSRDTPSGTITFSDYNNGIIILVIGISLIMLATTFIPFIIKGVRHRAATKEVNNE